MAEYSSLRLNAWLVLTSWFLPKRWRSERSNKLLELAEKGKEKVEKSLDIRKIIETQEDLKLFME